MYIYIHIYTLYIYVYISTRPHLLPLLRNPALAMTEGLRYLSNLNTIMKTLKTHSESRILNKISDFENPIPRHTNESKLTPQITHKLDSTLLYISPTILSISSSNNGVQEEKASYSEESPALVLRALRGGGGKLCMFVKF
jgi:hypothetical protein